VKTEIYARQAKSAKQKTFKLLKKPKFKHYFLA